MFRTQPIGLPASSRRAAVDRRCQGAGGDRGDAGTSRGQRLPRAARSRRGRTRRTGRLARHPADTLRQFLELSREADDLYHPLWVLVATTGMRRGEALGLRWSDIDLDAGRAHVVQTIIQTRNVVSIGEPKTARGRHAISLDPATVAVLRTHRHRMRQEQLLVGPDFADLGLVFHQPDGSWLRPDTVSEVFPRRVRRYGLPRLTLHGLRHTWATLALEQGIHPRVVQERLGPSTIGITLGIYSHITPTLHDEAAELIAGLLL